MSVASLTKFTVPLATDQSATSQGLLMPKLSYRFRASFDNFGVSQPKSELTKQIVSIARPQIAFNPIKSIHTTQKYTYQANTPGKQSHLTLEMTLITQFLNWLVNRYRNSLISLNRLLPRRELTTNSLQELKC